MYTSIKDYPNMVCPICHDDDILAICKDNSRLPVLSVCYNCEVTFEVLPNLNYVAPKAKKITKPEELFPLHLQYFILLYGLLPRRHFCEMFGMHKERAIKRMEMYCSEINKFCNENNLPVRNDTRSWDYYIPYIQEALNGLPYPLPKKLHLASAAEQEKLVDAVLKKMKLEADESHQLSQAEIEARQEFFLVRLIDRTE